MKGRRLIQEMKWTHQMLSNSFRRFKALDDIRKAILGVENIDKKNRENRKYG